MKGRDLYIYEEKTLLISQRLPLPSYVFSKVVDQPTAR
jgi:hypothetical protein